MGPVNKNPAAPSSLVKKVADFNARMRRKYPVKNIARKNPSGGLKAIFTMGLPAAGKSTLVEKRYAGRANYVIVDPDVIAAGLPGYDPKMPQLVHEKANAIAEERFQHALKARPRKHVILDSTGTRVSKLLGRMALARKAGYSIHLLYVTVPLEVSLQRNRERTRVVPEAVILQKAEEISASFNKVRPKVDSVEIVDTSPRVESAVANPRPKQALVGARQTVTHRAAAARKALAAIQLRASTAVTRFPGLAPDSLNTFYDGASWAMHAAGIANPAGQFSVGDLVRHKGSFLRSAGWYTNVPKNGRVTATNTQTGGRIVEVEWSDGNVMMINVHNIERVKGTKRNPSSIGNTIWQQIQLGVKRSYGARDPLGGNTEATIEGRKLRWHLAFRVRVSPRGLQKVLIGLNGRDLYDIWIVELGVTGSSKAHSARILASRDDVFVGDLNSTLLRMEGEAGTAVRVQHPITDAEHRRLTTSVRAKKNPITKAERRMFTTHIVHGQGNPAEGYDACRCCGGDVPVWLRGSHDINNIHTKCIPKHWGFHAHGRNASRCKEFGKKKPWRNPKMTALLGNPKGGQVKLPRAQALRLLDWHGGEETAVYALGSSSFAGHKVPMFVAENALRELKAAQNDVIGKELQSLHRVIDTVDAALVRGRSQKGGEAAAKNLSRIKRIRNTVLSDGRVELSKLGRTYAVTRIFAEDQAPNVWTQLTKNQADKRFADIVRDAVLELNPTASGEITRDERADLVNMFHTAKTALSGKDDSRYERLKWAAREFHKKYPSVSEIKAYKEVDASTRADQRNPIPKSTSYRVVRASTEAVVFVGSKAGAVRELKKRGGKKAGYVLVLSNKPYALSENPDTGRTCPGCRVQIEGTYTPGTYNCSGCGSSLSVT